jgi:CRP/FNR family cyclic AMP-dependent transcriptional regulator
MPSTPVYNIALEEHYRDGEILFEEGNSGDWVYVVLSGEVEVSKTVDGKTFILGTLKPGEVFGELALIGAVRRTATTRALGATRVGIVDRGSLDKEFNKLSADFRGILLALVARFIKVMDGTREFFSRRGGRVEKTLALKFQSRQQFLDAHTGNISRGGLFIQTRKPLAVHERFRLKLQVPGVERPLEIKCQVAWIKERTSNKDTKPAGMGVTFCEMSAKDSKVLEEYLKGIT